MPFIQKSYPKITEDILSHITKGILREGHEFETGRITYRLRHANALEIMKVEGIRGGNSHIFEKGMDYWLYGNMIEWLSGGNFPDESSPFFVNYRLNVPVEITDTNPGSVVRTIVESVALEIDYLYAQMNEVYNAGFIDTASGKSLDLVVSLLGIARKPAGPATGVVSFGRTSDPDEIQITRETHVFEGMIPYKLKRIQVREVATIEGSMGGARTTFVKGEDFLIDRNVIVWIEGKKNPDQGSVFYVDYSAFEEYIIPRDTRVSTYSRRPENIRIFRTLKETPLIKNNEGNWEVDIPVVAMVPGREGNVFAGSITVMPSPPIGIEYVINKTDILNGTDQETDNDLRERAKHALEMAGKATITSLKSAVEGIEGIVGKVKVVDQPDGIPGIVQIIASGGDEQVIRDVIEDTRSAGILVEFRRPILVPLNVNLTIVSVQGLGPDEIRSEVEKEVRNYLASLEIDEDVIISQIISAALHVSGVRDVYNVTINGESENIELKFNEKGELRSLDIFLGD